MNASSGDVPALEARDLTVVLGGQKIIDIPEFKVRTNETMMIIGPNGSGKSTLLLSLALLLKTETGTIYYRGEPVRSSDDMLSQRRRLAVVLQEPLLLNSSVMDNVTLGLKLRKVDRHAIRDRARKWLARFGVGALEKRQAKTLSGGEARRVSLARAFALEPEVLFLDEPFIALDSPTRQGLLEDFESVVRENRTTVVMVTHDRSESLVLGDRVTVIIGGSVRQCGTPQDVFSTPVDEEVASFVEAGNIINGIVTRQERGLAVIGVGRAEVQIASDLPVGTEITAYMHYEDVTLYLPHEDFASSARNRLRGRITRIFATGLQIKVFIDCGFTLVSVITRRSWEEMGLDIGKEVVASFKATALHPIPKHGVHEGSCSE